MSSDSELLRGVRWRINPQNQCAVLSIHYSADPRKDAEWKTREQRGMPRGEWNREYECVWDTFAGTPVFEQEYDDVLMTRDTLDVDPKRPMLRAWDFGYRHPACLVGQFYEATQIRLHRGWMGTNTDLQPFAEQCLVKCREQWPTARWEDCCDIAGAQVRANGPSDVAVLAKLNLALRYAKWSIAETLGWTREFMTRTWKRGEPRFLVLRHPDTEILRACLRGGYHYREDREEVAQDGFYEHLGDCVRYLVANFRHEGASTVTELERMAFIDTPPEREGLEWEDGFSGAWVRPFSS